MWFSSLSLFFLEGIVSKVLSNSTILVIKSNVKPEVINFLVNRLKSQITVAWLNYENHLWFPFQNCWMGTSETRYMSIEFSKSIKNN